MILARARAVWLVGVLALLAGCTKSTPSQPSVTVGIPLPQQPSNGSQVPFASQPVTLTVQNATLVGATGTTYRFEVATDTAFAAIVQTKDNITEGSGGQTSVKLDQIAKGGDYYWHARAAGGNATGQFGAVYKFTLGSALTLSAPVALGPLNGTQNSPRPTFRVSNAAHQGSAGAITYKFDLSRDSAFSTMVLSASSIPEGVNETDFTPPSDLPLGPLYWRATASDATNAVSSPASDPQNVTIIAYSQAERVAAQLGVVIWPGDQPPGNVGQAVMGDNWQIQILHHIPTNTFFQSPTVEDLRIFDLLDRGFDPDAAISWMNAHGYYTIAQWYPPPEKAVIGLAYTYIAARNKIVVNGTWDIVLKGE
jgi:hypothetical protein